MVTYEKFLNETCKIPFQWYVNPETKQLKWRDLTGPEKLRTISVVATTKMSRKEIALNTLKTTCMSGKNEWWIVQSVKNLDTIVKAAKLVKFNFILHLSLCIYFQAHIPLVVSIGTAKTAQCSELRS